MRDKYHQLRVRKKKARQVAYTSARPRPQIDHIRTDIPEAVSQTRQHGPQSVSTKLETESATDQRALSVAKAQRGQRRRRRHRCSNKRSKHVHEGDIGGHTRQRRHDRFLFTVVAWTQVAVKRKEGKRRDDYIVWSCSRTSFVMRTRSACGGDGACQ